MSRREIKQLAENELKPYDIDDYDISDVGGGYWLEWRKDGKKNGLNLPRDINIPRAKENFRGLLKRQLESAGISKLDSDKIRIDDQLREIERRLKIIDERLDLFSKEVESGSELSLTAASEVESLKAGLLGLLGQGATKKEPAPEPQKVVPIQRPEPIKPVERPEEPKKVAAKGLTALEQLRIKARADAIAEIFDQDLFDIDDFEGHILRFIHKCGPQTAHDLRQEQGGPWRSADRVTDLLQDMEAKGLLRFIIVHGQMERKYAITNKGIEALAPEPEDVIEPVAPVPLGSVEEMINPTPALRVVDQDIPFPPQRRILTPIAASPQPKPVAYPKEGPEPSFKEKLVRYMYGKGPLTLMELRHAGLGNGYKSELGNLMDAAKRGANGVVKNTGSHWVLTTEGRNMAIKLTQASQPVENHDLRRQFVK